MVEEKIYSVVLACDFKRNLSANESEADAQLKEKLLNVAYKAGLQLSFVSILGKGEEIEIVGVLEKLLGKIRLRLWKRGPKVGGGLPLASVKAAVDLHNENVSTPAILDGGLNVPEAFLWSLYLV